MIFLAGASAVSISAVLAASCVGHFRSLANFANTLGSHELLPLRFIWATVIAISLWEATSAAMLLYFFAMSDWAGLRVLGGVTGLIFAAMLCYLARLRRYSFGAQLECACGLDTTPLSAAHIIRTLLLTILCILIATTSASGGHIGGSARAFVVVGGLQIAALLVMLPSARSIPSSEERERWMRAASERRRAAL